MKTQTFSYDSSFSADLEATLKLYSSGSFRDIENVMSIDSRQSTGDYNSTWVPLREWSDPGANSSLFPVTSIVLACNGYFQILTNYSLTIGVDIKGFVNVGGSSGYTHTYNSKTMNIQGTYRTY